MKFLLSTILGGLSLIGGFFVSHQSTPIPPPQTQQTFGSTSFTPVQGIPYVVGKTILVGDSTITLSTFKTPDGRPLVMSNFGQIGYGTLDPNNLPRLESVSFSGITQNANGTATLTGVSRGLDFITPYAASTTLAQQHLVGSTFILSNSSAFYGQQFPFLNNPSTIAAVWTFGSTVQPTYDVNPSAYTSQLSLIDKAYADALSITGAPTSTEISMGVSQLATKAQLNANTASSTEGRPLVVPNKLGTSTCQISGGAFLVSSSTSGKLNGTCFDTTYSYTLTGLNSFTGTTSVSASNVNTNPLKINTVPYSFPSVQGASSTSWMNDGNGNFTNELQDWHLLTSTTTQNAMAIATTTFAGATHLKIFVSLSVSGTTDVPSFFNGDAGTNYGSNSMLDFGIPVKENNFNGWRFDEIASSSSRFIEMDVENTITLRKFFRWTETMNSSGSLAPGLIQGNGVWNNTSVPITSFELTCNNQTCNAGTRIDVYGSNN